MTNQPHDLDMPEVDASNSVQHSCCKLRCHCNKEDVHMQMASPGQALLPQEYAVPA